MKKIVPLFFLLLLMGGCIAPAGGISPSPQKLQPDWHYDLTSDGLYRTDINTGDVAKINEQHTAAGVIITEDWIYFKDDSRLYRMDNENRRELVTDEECRCPGLSGGWLYYISSSGINRLKPDGSEKEQIIQGQCNWLVLTDQYVFYALNVPESDELNSEPGADDGPWYMGQLHRIDLNGENDVIIEEMITELSTYENVIYFAHGEDFNLYSMNPETLEKRAVYDGHFIEHLYFGDGYAFFILDRNLYKMSLAEGTMTQLTKGYWNSCLGVLDGYVYGHNEQDGIYRFALDSVEMEKVE